MNIPEKPALEGLEKKWDQVWQSSGTYHFDRSKATRENIYSVDTPPPTASGSLHIGHAFSYTHTDIAARFNRMRGRDVFYPMGWDDNGLPTERRVQNYYGVRCDPTLPYDPNFVPPVVGGSNKSANPADQVPISRKNFIELCEKLTLEDEQVFEDIFRLLGLSVDWRQTYRTISDQSITVSQRSFLRNFARGEAYKADAPTLWDITFRTAVAQAELEDREQQGAYHSLKFSGPNGDIIIDTTRPELLPACVALVAHPDDERYQSLFGKTATTPIFGVEVPILAHKDAQIDKGTGIAMVCTFGDIQDVTWWRDLSLPSRAIIGEDGRIIQSAPDAIESEAGIAAFAELAGKTIFSAKKTIVEQLQAAAAMIGDPRPVLHPVKFYEKGDKPLEIVATSQWYINNSANDDALRARLIELGRELKWHPDFMRVRYENWVDGLTGDWLVSRQRFFGVPIPVWYRLDENGEVLQNEIIVPEESALPVDPSSDAPEGFEESQRGKPGGFIGDLDILDTWATSSLTPMLASGWESDHELFKLVYPYTVRPQGQDIIRTWLFATMLKSQLEMNQSPWEHATISGFIVDPDRKKMSKSKGNVVTPLEVLEQHGSDAVRYWSSSSKLGADAALDLNNPTAFKIGRRLAIKILNAGKLILGYPTTPDAKITEAIDLAFQAKLADVVAGATKALDDFDHARALEITEALFWEFCDDYLELVKERAYNSDHPGQASAVASMRAALSVFLRLFAPVISFATEEVWSWWQEGSVHRASWPSVAELAQGGNSEVLAAISQVLIAVRGAKTEAKVSQRAEVTSIQIAAPAAVIELAKQAADDLQAVGRIQELNWEEADSVGVSEIKFAEEATAN